MSGAPPPGGHREPDVFETPHGTPARVLALVGAGLLVAAGFLPWSADGRVGLDVAVFGDLTVAVLLVAAASLPAITALVDDHAWPRVAAAVVVGAGVVTVVADQAGGVPSGAVVADAGTLTLLVAAAASRGPAPADPPAATERRSIS